MSGRQVKGRRRGGFLPGLMFVSTGFFAGFYGIDYALSTAEGNADTTTASKSFDLDSLVTASIGEGRLDALKSKLSSIFTSTDYLVSDRDRQVDIAEVMPKTSDAAVNRSAKKDRTNTELATAVIAGQDAPVRATAQVSAHTSAQSEVQVREVAADTGASLKASSSHRQPNYGDPMVPRRDPGVQAPYADAADVALFAADMPLPSKMTAARAEAAAEDSSYYSPLIPRTFTSGKAFGGLGEEEFQRRERRCMVTALYFEARSESDVGQLAVGQVIMNRVKSPDYPDTICGVVYQGSQRNTGCQFSFTCDGKADRPENKAEWERSISLANKVLEGKVWLKSIGNSTHYHANYVRPTWRREMARINRVGRHIFYKSPEVSITAPYQRVGDEKRS